MKSIGEKIRFLRAISKLSQENVANEMKISVGYYSKLERDIIDLPYSRLEQLASVFKLSVVELLSVGEDVSINDFNKPNSYPVIKTLQERIKELEKEVNYLKEINALLRERINNEKSL